MRTRMCSKSSEGEAWCMVSLATAMSESAKAMATPVWRVPMSKAKRFPEAGGIREVYVLNCCIAKLLMVCFSLANNKAIQQLNIHLLLNPKPMNHSLFHHRQLRHSRFLPCGILPVDQILLRRHVDCFVGERQKFLDFRCLSFFCCKRDFTDHRLHRGLHWLPAYAAYSRLSHGFGGRGGDGHGRQCSERERWVKGKDMSITYEV